MNNPTDVRKGDTLTLFNGDTGLACSSVVRDSSGEPIVSFLSGGFRIPVQTRAINVVMRDGAAIFDRYAPQQMAMFEEAQSE